MQEEIVALIATREGVRPRAASAPRARTVYSSQAGRRRATYTAYRVTHVWKLWKQRQRRRLCDNDIARFTGRRRRRRRRVVCWVCFMSAVRCDVKC